MISFHHPNREAQYREQTAKPFFGGPRRQCKCCKSYKYTSGGTTKNGFTCKECIK